MTQVYRWITRYGEKIKFVEVVDAAKQLKDAIDSDDSNLIKEQLDSFTALYSKIEIVKSEEMA